MLRRWGPALAQRLRPQQCSSNILRGSYRHISVPPDDPKDKERKSMRSKTAAASDSIDRRVWPIALSSLFMGTAVGVIIPVMPMFVRELGISTTEFGLIISSMGVARLFFNIPAAYLADTIGRKPCLIGGPIGTSISIIGTGLSSSFQELVGWRVLTGAGGSAQMTAAQLYLADISTPKNRARTMAPMQAAFQIGAAVGPSIAGLLAFYYGLRQPLFFVGGVIGLVALNNYMMLTETADRRDQEAMRQKGLGKQIQSVLSTWKEIGNSTNAKSVMLAQLTYWITASGSQLTLLPLLAAERFDFSTASIGGLFTMFAIVNVLAAQPIAHLSDRFGRKAIIVPSLATVAACVAAVPQCTTNLQLYAVAALWALGGSGMGSVPVAYLSDITTKESRGQALAMFRSAGDLGLVLGAGMLGAVAGSFSIDTAMMANAGILTGASLQFLFQAQESDSP